MTNLNSLEHLGSFWPETNRPFDAKTYFNNLEDVDRFLTDSMRYKGLKFVVRDVFENKGTPQEKNIGPLEYWVVKDYIPPGLDEETWEDIPAFIPTLENGGMELYQPGGGELPPLSGETIMASLDPNFPYKGLELVSSGEDFVTYIGSEGAFI